MKLVVVAAALTLLTPAAVIVNARPLPGPPPAAYADGAPPGFSGGGNEQSCHACHFDADVNSGPGRVTIADLPQDFAPRQRYPLTITLTRPGMKLAGFQMTVRFKDGGAQAGTLAVADGDEKRVSVEVQQGVAYANQRRHGAILAEEGIAQWRLVWTAPDTAAPVVFDVAANAANGDETADGDYVHTASVEITPQAPRDRR